MKTVLALTRAQKKQKIRENHSEILRHGKFGLFGAVISLASIALAIYNKDVIYCISAVIPILLTIGCCIGILAVNENSMKLFREVEGEEEAMIEH